MNWLKTLKKLMVVAFAVGMISFVGQSTTSAASPPDGWVWRQVTVYEYVERPYSYYVTRYKSCGTAYRVRVTSHRRVVAPVTKWVRVSIY